VADVAARARQLDSQLGLTEAAFADYAYALQFLPSADVVWRRALLCRRRGNFRAALADSSMAVAMAKHEHG